MRTEGSRPRVLVVDDEEDVREMMASILSDVGYVVTTVADGAAALAAVKRDPFALATLDLRMPGMSGRETLVGLRAIAPDMPVVVVSGHVTPAEAQACVAHGAFAIVRKPFSLKVLLATVERAEAQRRTRDTPPGP